MSDDELEQEITQREAAMTGLQPYQVRANRAVSTKLLRDIVNDSRRGPTAPSSLAGPSQSAPRRASGGTTEEKPPPGIEHIDRMCDAQDRRDRAIAHQQAAELAWIEGLLERKNPHKAKTNYDPFRGKEWGSTTTDVKWTGRLSPRFDPWPATGFIRSLRYRLSVLSPHWPRTSDAATMK